MNTQAETSRLSSRSRRWLGAGLVALALGGLSAAGIGYAEGNPPPHEGMMGMHEPMNPEQMQKHVDKMIERLVPDATAQQKEKLNTIAKSALTDLKPLTELPAQDQHGLFLLDGTLGPAPGARSFRGSSLLHGPCRAASSAAWNARRRSS